MVSKVKLYRQLDSLESELVERLIPHLDSAVTGDNDLIFCVAEFDPYPERRNRTDSKTEALIGLGRRILALMEKLGESPEGSAAERICWYCSEWGNHSNQRRNGARELAQQFLEEIRANERYT